jgi:hypothetical protein
MGESLRSKERNCKLTWSLRLRGKGCSPAGLCPNVSTCSRGTRKTSPQLSC